MNFNYVIQSSLSMAYYILLSTSKLREHHRAVMLLIHQHTSMPKLEPTNQRFLVDELYIYT